jgi:probable HAF family extracellular repeat protein
MTVAQQGAPVNPDQDCGYRHDRSNAVCRRFRTLFLLLAVAAASGTVSARQGYIFYHLGIAGTVGGVAQPLSIGSVPLSGSIGTVLGADDHYPWPTFDWVGNTLTGNYCFVRGVPSAISQNGAWAAMKNLVSLQTCSPLGDVAGRGAWLTTFCVTGLGVNNSGLVVGEGRSAINGWPIAAPFVLSCMNSNGCGTPVFMPTLGGGYGSARAINNYNVIVGVSAAASGFTRAFYVTANSTQPQDFDPARPRYNSVANAINDAGTTVGTLLLGPCPQGPILCIGSSSSSYPIIFGGRSGVTVIGSLGGTQGAANAIDSFGDIVGWSTVSSGQQHGFLYSGGVMTDLNTVPLFNTAGQKVVDWTITEADGINDLGQIVGRATSAVGGKVEVVVLTP